MKLHGDGEPAESRREYTERSVGLLREMGMEDAEKYYPVTRISCLAEEAKVALRLLLHVTLR